MAHVDAQGRRGDRGRLLRRGRSRRGGEEGVSPHLKVAGLLLGLVVFLALSRLGPAGFVAGLLVAVCTLVAGVVVLLQELGRPERPSPQTALRLGAEKQLLLALRESGGLTAVEAALETSLTVDEAEGMLSSLAERGHLLIENRSGALSYALPGRSPGPPA